MSTLNYPTLTNPASGESFSIKKGFSWPAFLFTPIWCIFKGLWLQAIVSILLGITGFGLILWIIFGVKGNEWYFDSLVKKGYIVS